MKKIKVLIIDDSSIIRSIIHEVLISDESIDVVGEAEDPFIAREKIKLLNPDIITLDVEMPKMDGITFLKNLMRLRPMPVIMLSTLTTKGADITLQALELGALDFIAKPSFEELTDSKSSFQNSLLSKIKAAVIVEQKNYKLTKPIFTDATYQPIAYDVTIRNDQIIAIGASTGGTEAIKHVLKQLPNNFPPIVIIQHIPKAFSERFAGRLNEHCNLVVQEARHGQKLKPGHVYVAPGDEHLIVVEKGRSYFCLTDHSPPVNHHKPSVDVLFNSLLPMASKVQAVLLTGMGSDGAQGMLALKNAGARTIIQDQNSSLVWGMPGKAFAANAHTDIFDLFEIPVRLLEYATKNKH